MSPQLLGNVNHICILYFLVNENHDSDLIPLSFKYFNHKSKEDFTYSADRHTLPSIINDMTRTFIHRMKSFIDTLTESDADRKWRWQNETQPYRGPGGLNFGWLVDQYMASLSSKN